jgi:sec-independent protein translocase protein TatA
MENMINTLAYFNIEVAAIILVGVLVMFGGKKIPELMRGIGQGVGELKKGMEDGQKQIMNSIHHDDSEKTQPVVVTPVVASEPKIETPA